MKIVIMSIFPNEGSTDPNKGGVAWYTKKIITNTPFKKEDKIFVICNKIDGQRREYKDGKATVIRCLDRNYKFIFQAFSEIKRINPDVLHIQQELHLYGGLLTAWLLQWLIFLLRKYNPIITLHGVVSLKIVNKQFINENNSNAPVLLAKAAFLIIYKPLLKYSTKIIVHETFFRNILVKEYQGEVNKIEVIHLGVDKTKPLNKSDARKKLGLKDNSKVILFLGYLTGYKGLGLLIDAFSEFIKTEKNAFLLIASGKHPKLTRDKNYLRMYYRCKEKARRLLPKNHRWSGFIPDKEIKNYISAADLTIYPYTACISSSGPMSIGMGYGKPFLVSDVFRGIIDNKNLIFKRDIKDIVSVLSFFYMNESYVKKEILKMRENRLWTKTGTKTYNLYLSLIK